MKFLKLERKKVGFLSLLSKMYMNCKLLVVKEKLDIKEKLQFL